MVCRRSAPKSPSFRSSRTHRPYKGPVDGTSVLSTATLPPLFARSAPPGQKNSPAAIQRFDEIVAVDGAKRGLLFGCPVYIFEGERYATLYQDRVVLRLRPADAAQLLARGGRAFEPIKGRKSKDRVVLPDRFSANPRSLRTWVRKAVAYARS